MLLRRLAPALIAAALLAAAGCGTDESPELGAADGKQAVTLPEFMDTAKRVCGRHKERISEIVRELDRARAAEDGDAFIAAYRRVVDEMEATFDDIAAMRWPPALHDSREETDRQARKILEVFAAAAAPLEQGDLRGAIKVAQRGQTAALRWVFTMQATGLETCASTIEAVARSGD